MASEHSKNDKIYIHEFVDMLGHGRPKYMHHMTANFVPVGREAGVKCFAVWALVGSTGEWPCTVNLWELDGWPGIARHIGREASGKHGDFPEDEAEWWSRATEFRRGGRDRIMRPAPWVPTIDQHVAAGTRGALYLHELVTTQPGGSRSFLDSTRDLGRAARAPFGMQLVCAMDNDMSNGREAVLVWAVDAFDSWAAFEAAKHEDAKELAWQAESRPFVERWERIALLDNPLNPMVLGRQPSEADRRPLSEI